MQIFKETPTFDFIGMRTKAFLLSGLLAGASMAVLLTRGLNWGIDFTGGSVLQVTYESPRDLQEVRNDLSRAGFSEAIPQHFTGSNSFAIRLKGSEEHAAARMKKLSDGLSKA